MLHSLTFEQEPAEIVGGLGVAGECGSLDKGNGARRVAGGAVSAVVAEPEHTEGGRVSGVGCKAHERVGGHCVGRHSGRSRLKHEGEAVACRGVSGFGPRTQPGESGGNAVRRRGRYRREHGEHQGQSRKNP